MTQEQGFRLVTRAFALYFFIWIASDLLALPRELLTLRHELKALALRSAEIPPSVTESTVYFFRYAVMGLGGSILRVTGMLMVARWFIRGGPWLRRFFAGNAPE